MYTIEGGGGGGGGGGHFFGRCSDRMGFEDFFRPAIDHPKFIVSNQREESIRT